MKKIVYIAMSTDILHEGHIKVINEGAKYGEVVIGLLSDKAISEYKRMPLLTFEERKTVFENIKNVSKVVRQDFLDYTAILRRIKPDYVVHGDDWKEGVQQQTRAKVIETLKEWGGQLIEVPYTRNVSSSNIEAKENYLTLQIEEERH